MLLLESRAPGSKPYYVQDPGNVIRRETQIISRAAGKCGLQAVPVTVVNQPTLLSKLSLPYFEKQILIEDLS